MTVAFAGFFHLYIACGENIRHKSGNSHIVGIAKVMMPPIELLKC